MKEGQDLPAPHFDRDIIPLDNYGNYEFETSVTKGGCCFWNIIKKTSSKNESENESKTVAVTFQNCMKFPLLFAQMLGLIPVKGILQENVENLRFTAKSGIFWFSLLLMMTQLIASGLNVWRAVTIPVNVALLTSVLYNLRTWLIAILFFRLAMKWPNLVKDIANTETMDPLIDSGLKSRCNIATIAVIALTAIEYLLSMVAYITDIIICSPEAKDVYEEFSNRIYVWIFSVIPPSRILRLFVQFLSIIGLYYSNFIDLFIVCISYYITSRLEQVNKRILTANGKYFPSQFWQKMREDYSRLTKLVVRVDKDISSVVCLSFANNLLFVCLLLFRTLSLGIKYGPTQTACQDPNRKGIFGGYEYTVYNLFSLILLMGRSLFVLLIASRIHAATLKPAIVLFNVPSAVYCIEVQRFLAQVHGHTVALSGLRFFKVTRGLLLSMVASIVTYELVLLQLI